MSFTAWFRLRDLDFIHAYERIPYNNWVKFSSPIYTAVITRETPTAHQQESMFIAGNVVCFTAHLFSPPPQKKKMVFI